MIKQYFNGCRFGLCLMLMRPNRLPESSIRIKRNLLKLFNCNSGISKPLWGSQLYQGTVEAWQLPISNISISNIFGNTIYQRKMLSFSKYNIHDCFFMRSRKLKNVTRFFSSNCVKGPGPSCLWRGVCCEYERLIRNPLHPTALPVHITL